VEDGVSDVIGLVRIVWYFVRTVFEEVDDRLEVIVLGSHEENVLLLFACNLHIGPMFLQELDHFVVTV
jgi:hypothetical protein